MKKNYISATATVLAALLASGCQQMEKPGLYDGTAVKLASVSTGPLTKAVITGSSFTPEEAVAGIGLFLLDDSGSTYGRNSDNVKYTYNDSNGIWTASQPLRVGGGTPKLYGYYPYSSSVSDISAIPVESSINGIDYLYATPESVTADNADKISLKMQHALARLRITVKKDASYVGAGTLTAFSIESDGIAASGRLNVFDGTISATTAAFSVTGITEVLSTTGITEDCLIVPTASSKKEQSAIIYFTIDDVKYKLALNGTNAIKIQQGIQTDITVSVKNNGISLDELSLGMWGEGSSREIIGLTHKVTVKLAEVDGIKDDVVIMSYVEDNSVNIKAYCLSGKPLECTLSGIGQCSSSKTGNIRLFTITDICSDLTATIDYKETVSLNATVYPSNVGTINIDGYRCEDETVSVSAVPNDHNWYFVEWLDADGQPLKWTNPQSITLTSGLTFTAVFREFEERMGLNNYCVPSTFTVNSEGKKVHFSKGNLYAEKNNNKWSFFFEDEQYQFNAYMSESHLSYFHWTDNAESAVSTNLTDDYSSYFFTNSPTSPNSPNPDFCIDGKEGRFRTLTNDEVNYLIDHYNFMVTNVCGVNGVVLIPENFGGTVLQSYSASSWSSAEKHGLVFFPLTGQWKHYNNTLVIEGLDEFFDYWLAYRDPYVEWGGTFAAWPGMYTRLVSTLTHDPMFFCPVRLVCDVREEKY